MDSTSNLHGRLLTLKVSKLLVPCVILACCAYSGQLWQAMQWKLQVGCLAVAPSQIVEWMVQNVLGSQFPHLVSKVVLAASASIDHVRGERNTRVFQYCSLDVHLLEAF